LIDGVNDDPEQARKLVKLLRTVPSKLNLIPFNPFPGTRYRCSSPDRISRFQEIVMQGGLIATVRKTRGEDIDAACGQLVGKVLDRSVNDDPEQARKLVKLLRTVPSKLNLIPFNPFPGTRYRCSSPDRISRFQEIVMQGGLIATVRKTRGEDIDAACGQLVGKVLDRTKRSERIKLQLAESTP